MVDGNRNKIWIVNQNRYAININIAIVTGKQIGRAHV